MSFAFTFADDELDEEYFQGSSNGTESMASDGQSAAAAQEPASAKEGVCKELSLRELVRLFSFPFILVSHELNGSVSGTLLHILTGAYINS